ncbi:hypothetical protein BC834DRAFT_892182 [Gloeopeniophorella convolvens]|nr:hypothetical protein BC834DRAFT_892182 [Gloeopeniophorella convolvens]
MVVSSDITFPVRTANFHIRVQRSVTTSVFTLYRVHMPLLTSMTVCSHRPFPYEATEASDPMLRCNHSLPCPKSTFSHLISHRCRPPFRTLHYTRCRYRPRSRARADLTLADSFHLHPTPPIVTSSSRVHVFRPGQRSYTRMNTFEPILHTCQDLAPSRVAELMTHSAHCEFDSLNLSDEQWKAIFHLPMLLGFSLSASLHWSGFPYFIRLTPAWAHSDTQWTIGTSCLLCLPYAYAGGPILSPYGKSAS